MSKVDSCMSLPDIKQSVLNYTASKPSPCRKLSLETDVSIMLVKLRFGLLQKDRRAQASEIMNLNPKFCCNKSSLSFISVMKNLVSKDNVFDRPGFEAV